MERWKQLSDLGHPGHYEERAVQRWQRYAAPLVHLAFRPRLEGANNLPDGPFMLVGNHSGMGLAEIMALVVCWLARFGTTIYFACHDAPVILYQADSLEQFLSELFRMCKPPHRSLVDDVHEDRIAYVWRTNPGVLSHEMCLRSDDPILSAFARELDTSFQIIDLRRAKPGEGFAWGRYGPRTPVKRFAMHALFAYQKRMGLFARLFGRAG